MRVWNCLWLLQALLLLTTRSVSAQLVEQIIQLSSQEFYNLATTGQVDVIIDVRTTAEWNNGHIENATFVDSLQSQLRNSNDKEATLRALNLWGCRQCRVVVYCGSGARAGAALAQLLEAGFGGTLYNGLGVGQWQRAGYPLVDDESNDDLPCMASGLNENEDVEIEKMAKKAARQSTAESVCRRNDPSTITSPPVMPLFPEDNVNMVDYELHQMELTNARDLFMAQMQAHNATAYSFDFTLTCFCPSGDYPWKVTAEMQQLMMGVKPNLTEAEPMMMMVNPVHTVTGDVVTSAVTTADEDIVLLMVENNNAIGYKTYSILDLFDKIQDAIDRQAAEIRVVYNPDWGYPQAIFIDYVFAMMDEEFNTEVANFEWLEIAPSMMEDDDDKEDTPPNAIAVDEGDYPIDVPEQPIQKTFGW